MATVALPLDDNTAKRVREVSRAVFGSAHRLEVAAAIADAKGKPVYSRQISERINAKPNQVGEVLRHFERGGLLQRLPTRGGRDPQRLQPSNSRFWALCQGYLSDLVNP